MVDFVSAFATLKNASEVLHAMRGIEKKFDEATLKIQIADLSTAVADARIALSEARTELAEKQQEIDRLKASFEQSKQLVEADRGYLYSATDDGKPIGWPVCPRCKEMNGRIVQLKQNGPITHAICPACGTEFKPVTAYRDPALGGHATEEELVHARRRERRESFQRGSGRTDWMA